MAVTHRFEDSPLDIILGDVGHAKHDISEYFSGYSGSRFEDLAEGNQDPNTITADDMVAVATLGVTIGGVAVIWLTEAAAAVTDKLESHSRRYLPLGRRRRGPRTGQRRVAAVDDAQAASLEWEPRSTGADYDIEAARRQAATTLPLHDMRLQAALYEHAGQGFDFWGRGAASWSAGRPPSRRSHQGEPGRSFAALWAQQARPQLLRRRKARCGNPRSRWVYERRSRASASNDRHSVPQFD